MSVSSSGARLTALTATHGQLQVMPTSFAQRRFWVLAQLEESAAYTLPVGLRLHGALDTGALALALNAIVARHESLRTVFEVEGDEPAQVVLPSLHVPLPVHDLRALATEAREAEVRARADANANASFDLATGPLLRAELLRLGESEHVLLLSLHHIVADGWSIGVLFAELETTYGALLAGREPDLPPLGLQYPDFAVWQRRAMQGAGASKQIAYWTERLRGVSPLELPTDRPRPAVQTLSGSHREVAIDGGVAEGIRALARREGATPYMGFLAAFFALLHRYSGQTDLVVGSITSGRRRPEVEPIIGLFLNTLAIRTEVSADASFLDLLARVRDAATGAYANQDVPFEHVVDAVQPARDRSRSPIFQVAFQLLETLARELRLPGVTASRVSGAKDTAKFELTLMLHSAPNGGLRAVLEYNSDLFDGATAERMLAQYVTLLAGVVRDPGARVGRLPLMGADEYALVTERWNATAAPLPEWTTPQRVLARAAEHPDVVAVRAKDRSLTYGDLARRSASLARRILELGVGPGDRVAVCMDRTSELLVALLAVHRAGAAYVPLDAAHPPDRLAHVVNDAAVSAVLTDLASTGRLPAVEAPVITLDHTDLDDGLGDALATPAIDPESAAYVIYTSGSTGQPKGVVVPHRALSNFLASMAERPGISRGDALVAVTTVAFDIAGLELWLPLIAGARVELASRAEAADGVALRARLEAAGVAARTGRAILQATPATWTLLVEAGWPGAANAVMLCGGEAWPPKLAESLLPRGESLWNVYGPTETTIWSARHRVTRADDVPLGEPLANTTLLVLEPSGEPAPPCVPGELWIGGAGLATGYHGRPDLTAERFVQHAHFGRLYRTGDRVRRRADGGLQYLGRLDDQIKVRGYRIELGEIEAVLAAQPDVAQAVVALRHDGGEPRLVAYVVLAPGASGDASRLSALAEPMRRALPEYMVPRTVVALDALPLSPSGKVDRRALPAPAEDGEQAGAAYVAPRTTVEERIAAVWAEVLGRERVSVADDFFALGGHSLLAMRVVARLADAFPARLTIGALFDARTVAALAALVEERMAEHDPRAARDRILPRGGDGPAPLSYAQELLWLYEQMKPGTAAYHIPMARRVRGALDVRALRDAFGALVAHHESLRTRFVEVDGVPGQVVAAASPVAIEERDLRAMPAERRAAEAERMMRETAARPFDLRAESHPRVLVIRLTADESLLLVVAHHIVFDGASTGLLMGQLTTAYTAALAGAVPVLPPLPIQLADVAAWERRELQGDRLAPTLSYWRKQLEGAPSGVDLPTDFPRPAETVGPGARHAGKLSARTRDALRTLAASHDVTMFMALIAGFQAVLHRYSGQSDVVVGTAVAGRERPGTAGLVGYLANTLALRARFEGDPGFDALLRQTRETTLRALDHQDVPYEKLVRELRAGQPPEEHTLFRVMFTLQDPDVGLPPLGSATLETLGIDLGSAKFDLTVSAAEVADGVEIVVEYRRDLFRADTIARLVSHLDVLLASACRAPATPVSRLAIVTDAEQRLMLETWNDTDAAWPEHATLHELFAEQARRRPDAVAVEYEGERMSYAELDRRANRIGWRLRALGVAPGELVAVCMSKSADVVAVLLGILKAGGAYVPMDPAYPDDRLAFMLEDSRARVLVTEPDIAPRVRQGSATVLLAADAAAEGAGSRDDAPPPSAGSADPCYVIYTSGSTGRPKGVMVEHRNVVRLLINDRLQFTFGETDVWTVFHSFSFDFSVWEMYGALLHGGRVVVVPLSVAQQPQEYLRLLETRGVTVLNQVPSAFYVLMQEALSRPRAALGLRYVIFGGEALQPALLRDFKARYPATTLVNMFGITETTVHVTFKEIGAAEIENGASNIGGPIPTLTTYVLDEHLQLVPIGVTGELCVGGAGVARGYVNRPELTAERFVPHPFRAGERMYRSGDLGRLRPTGEIEYLGRRDSQVKLRGFRIELGEIEATLAQHPAIASCVTVVRSDGAAGMRLVAYYVTSGALERGALRAWAASRLPEFMVPAAFVELPVLPLTSNGKVDRRALPAPTDEAADVEREHVAPRTPLEEQIAAVWAEVLGRERVSVLDDFFAMGGHSLLAMRVLGRLSSVLPVRLTISALFEARTVAALASLAVQRLAEHDAAASSDDELAAMLAELEGLSDDDAVRMLDAGSLEGS